MKMILLNILKNWKRYFSKVSKKYKHKIDIKIREIVNKNMDSNEYGVEIYEDRLLKYDDYVKDIQYSREIKIDDILKNRLSRLFLKQSQLKMYNFEESSFN
jgi:hypothetical protein